MHKSGINYRLVKFNGSSHLTEGQWTDWDPHNPPTEYMELAGSKQQAERPDQWITPDKFCHNARNANVS
jgi:DNA ligase 4